MLHPSVLIAFLAAGLLPAQPAVDRLQVSSNHRFLQRANGAPFFWLADTGWLLFQQLDRADAERYLENRRVKGFNVIQAMVLHSADDRNVYGNAALLDRNPATPRIGGEKGYWEHIDWIVDRAAERGIYLAMVPAWGSLAKAKQLNSANAAEYAGWLAERYKSKPNIVWLLGGDIRGDENLQLWRAMGRKFKEADPLHLVTFHPFGRTQSSQWFHNDSWLDFDMFQSGHRTYAQDIETPEPKGEDNWRYVREDYAKDPPKPTVDGEPSYEGIPQGLHDTTQPYWKAADARRYAWWSVFAGAFGHTYGNNAVMQMYKPPTKGAYGPRSAWTEAIDDPGAGQMQYLKNLILSRPFFERVYAPEAVAGENGARYERVMVTRGKSYLFAYTYTGRPFRLHMSLISGKKVRAWYLNPRDGSTTQAGIFDNTGDRLFTPPGTPAPGNDWVLVLDDTAAGFTK